MLSVALSGNSSLTTACGLLNAHSIFRLVLSGSLMRILWLLVIGWHRVELCCWLLCSHYLAKLLEWQQILRLCRLRSLLRFSRIRLSLLPKPVFVWLSRRDGDHPLNWFFEWVERVFTLRSTSQAWLWRELLDAFSLHSRQIIVLRLVSTILTGWFAFSRSFWLYLLSSCSDLRDYFQLLYFWAIFSIPSSLRSRYLRYCRLWSKSTRNPDLTGTDLLVHLDNLESLDLFCWALFWDRVSLRGIPRMVRSDKISGALGRLKSRWLMAWAGSLQLCRRWIVSVGDLAFASRPLGSHLLLRSGTILVSATRIRRFSLSTNDSLLHMELGATLYLLERHLNNIWSWRTLRKNCLAMCISLTDSFKQLHIQSLLWNLQAYALSSRWSRLASFLAIVISHSRDLGIRCGCWVTADVWVLTLLLRSAFWVHHYLSH